MLLIFVYDAHFCSIFHEYCQDENMGVNNMGLRNSASGCRWDKNRLKGGFKGADPEASRLYRAPLKDAHINGGHAG